MSKHTIPVSSPSKAGLQRSDVETFARKLEDRFRAIAEVYVVSPADTSVGGRSDTARFGTSIERGPVRVPAR